MRQVGAGPTGEVPFVIEVQPWDDLAALAASEAAGMGLRTAGEGMQLEAWLRDQLSGDAAFQAMRMKHGLPRLQGNAKAVHFPVAATGPDTGG